MSSYLSLTDPLDLPGRLALIWGTMTPTAQQNAINRASGQIDGMTGQDGGLALQTGKTETFQVYGPTDTIFLPNKPILALSALSRIPRGGSVLVMDLTLGQALFGDGQRIQYTPQSTNAWLPWPRHTDTPFVDGDVVSVTYSCGFVTIPDAIKQATLLILGMQIMATVDNPGGASYIKEGDAMIQHRPGENSAESQVRTILEPFRVVQL